MSDLCTFVSHKIEIQMQLIVLIVETNPDVINPLSKIFEEKLKYNLIA